MEFSEISYDHISTCLVVFKKMQTRKGGREGSQKFWRRLIWIIVYVFFCVLGYIVAEGDTSQLELDIKQASGSCDEADNNPGAVRFRPKTVIEECVFWGDSLGYSKVTCLSASNNLFKGTEPYTPSHQSLYLTIKLFFSMDLLLFLRKKRTPFCFQNQQ